MTNESGFNIYSIGIVAEDKPVGSDDIEVVPSELIVDANGDIAAREKITSNITSPFGEKETINVETGNAITARWLSFGSNRGSAPDVCKGESVLLFYYRGTDQYYWLPLFFEPELRKKETVVYYFANKTSASGTSNSASVTASDLLKQGYYFKVDTRDKKISLHTPNNDGEPAKYNVVLDIKQGVFTLEDDKENKLTIDSVNSLYNLKLIESTLTFDGKNKKYNITIDGNTLTLNGEDKSFDVTIEDKMTFNFKTVAMSNGSDELISLLLELIAAIIQEQHLGNLGAPTALMATSVQKYTDIKTRLSKFKG